MYAIEAKLALFTVGYFKILILILKVITKRKLKEYRKGRRKEIKMVYHNTKIQKETMMEELRNKKHVRYRNTENS